MSRKSFLTLLAGLLCIPRAKALEKHDGTYWQPLRLNTPDGSRDIAVLAKPIEPPSTKAPLRLVYTDGPDGPRRLSLQ